ncbi:MAG: DUF559 domain-containing protein [Flavisolibacter sp.]
MVYIQKPISFSNYIFLFYCHASCLVIAVEVSIHQVQEVKNNDEQRQKQLEEQGLVFLRFTNNEIKLQ